MLSQQKSWLHCLFIRPAIYIATVFLDWQWNHQVGIKKNFIFQDKYLTFLWSVLISEWTLAFARVKKKIVFLMSRRHLGLWTKIQILIFFHSNCQRLIKFQPHFLLPFTWMISNLLMTMHTLKHLKFIIWLFSEFVFWFKYYIFVGFLESLANHKKKRKSYWKKSQRVKNTLTVCSPNWTPFFR